MARKITWVLMLLSAILVALYAVVLLLMPGIRPAFIQNLFARFPVTTLIHFMGGAVAIVAGALQFSVSLRLRYRGLHRWLGRAYVFSIVFAGVAGLILAVNSIGGLYVASGFGLMAVFWLATTLNAYRLIRQGHVKSRQDWMLRSYAVTLAGVTLRLYLGVSVILGIKFFDAYPVLAWICWVPNLLVAEWLIRRRLPVARESERPGPIKLNLGAGRQT